MSTTAELLNGEVMAKGIIADMVNHAGVDIVMQPAQKGKGTSPDVLKQEMEDEKRIIFNLAKSFEPDFEPYKGQKVDTKNIRINEYGEIERTF